MRSASLISVMLRSLYGEESQEYAVADPISWGLDKADLGGMCCDFLAYLAGPSVAETRQVAAALRQVDPEFDGGLIETSAANVGSKCLLRGEVATRLCLILDAERWRAQAEAAEAAAKAGGRVGLRGGAEDPFRHVPEAGEGNGDFEKEYGSALRDFVHQQVECLSPRHHFDRRRESAALTNPKKVTSELFRKLPKMLPCPPHPDSAIFALIEEEALNFARFVISGPVGTPYEGGLFVFDVFLPASYPDVAPMVVMATTGQGTVKFNVNLYADGKVCLSILGTGNSSSTGGQRWDPDTSSLWQVFASIQTQVLVEDPYYNEGGGRSHMRGKGTAETDEASAAENARITIETIRHAAVANLRDPPRGCESLIRAHFKATRNRMLRRCREACEHAPNERVRKATLKASMELRVELDRLEEGSEEKAEEG